MPSTCDCEVDKYLKNIVGDVVIICDVVIVAPDIVSISIIATYKMDYYILHTLFVSNHIVINSYCYYLVLFH